MKETYENQNPAAKQVAVLCFVGAVCCYAIPFFISRFQWVFQLGCIVLLAFGSYLLIRHLLSVVRYELRAKELRVIRVQGKREKELDLIDLRHVTRIEHLKSVKKVRGTHTYNYCQSWRARKGYTLTSQPDKSYVLLIHLECSDDMAALIAERTGLTVAE